MAGLSELSVTGKLIPLKINNDCNINDFFLINKD
jgi:hypothetical protein